MDRVKFLDIDCVLIENDFLELLVTESVGPRIISLKLKGGENLFAEIPNAIEKHESGEDFHFYGGHRLWHAPEGFPRTYMPDNAPVHISHALGHYKVQQTIELETGIEKSIEIVLGEDKPQVFVHHTLTNRGQWPVTCAPWAITQLKPGGIALLPQAQMETGYLPNRALNLWPYSDITIPELQWGNRLILLQAELEKPFKVGFPNPAGWLAYWQAGTLFVKHAKYNVNGSYFDFGSSSECYCNDQILELETLGEIITLNPEESVVHTETWELYADITQPTDEKLALGIVKQLGLGE